MSSVRVMLEEDCTIILERALLRKVLNAFGEDGFGKYGRKDTPSYFPVVDIRVDIDDSDLNVIKGKLSICLRGYDANDVGHIQTDQNFEISLNEYLKDAGINKAALEWAPIDEQVDGCVTFDLDVKELLGY